jgi:hypothetical protein
MERFSVIDNNNRCLKNAFVKGFCNAFKEPCLNKCQYSATNAEADAIAALMIISPHTISI